jgi:hypothetical protein
MTNRSSKNTIKTSAKKVEFYSPEFYCFDNFSAHQVKIWGKVFPTAEHAYQWKKFADTKPKIAESILAAPSPILARETAIKNKSSRLSNWEDLRVQIMTEILNAKYSQHKDVQQKLPMTGAKIIVGNPPSHKFWGVGENNKGANVFGKIWMKIRNDIEADGKN